MERCYLASPLGFAATTRGYYSRVLLPALAQVVVVVDPWSLASDDEFADAHAAGRGYEFSLEVAGRNARAIRSCTLLAAVLDGQEIDSGTASEVGYGSAHGLICHGLRTDLRQSGEPGMHVNLQVEGFIVQSGGVIVPTLEELVVALANSRPRRRRWWTRHAAGSRRSR